MAAPRRRRRAGVGILPPIAPLSPYFYSWAGDPQYANPGNGVAAPLALNRGSLAASGAYLDPTLGLSVPAVAQNYATTPSSAAYDVTTFEHIECVYLSDVPSPSPVYLHGRWGSAGTRHFLTLIDTAGRTGVTWTADGTTSTTILSINTLGSVGITDGSWVWLRRRFTPDDGAGNRVFTTHYSTESHLIDVADVTWTLLDTRTTVGASSIVTGVSYPMVSGALNELNPNSTANKVAYQQLNASIGGSPVLAIDFRRPLTNQFTAATGQTVTVASTFNAVQATGSAQPLWRASSINGRPAWDFGGDDLLQIATASLAQPFTVGVVVMPDTTTGTQAAFGTSTSDNKSGIGIDNPAGARWYHRHGTTVGGGTPTAATPVLVTSFASGASSKLQINGTTVSTDNANTEALARIALGSDGTGVRFFDGKMGFAFAFSGDATTAAGWPAFQAWLREHYGLW